MRELKTHLSAWLSRAQAGEVVEVTSHHKPIARITAVKPKDPSSTSPVQEAIDAGVLSWSGQKPVFGPPINLNDGGPLISDLVIEARFSRYGRTVAEVISEININQALVVDGQAFAYRQYLSGCNARESLDAEVRASRRRSGVWQAPGGGRDQCREIDS